MQLKEILSITGHTQKMRLINEFDQDIIDYECLKLEEFLKDAHITWLNYNVVRIHTLIANDKDNNNFDILVIYINKN